MSDESKGVELDMGPLNKILAALKENRMVKVGILGSGTIRKGGSATEQGTNASIGLKHEFGLDGMPIRSFLRMPLIDNLQHALSQANALSPAILKRVVKSGKLDDYLRKIGILAEGIIADAFDSGGFGKWKPSNMKMKKNHQTLVETQQLRNSITSELE